MTPTIETFTKSYLKTGLPEIRSGDIVKVHQKVKEGDPSSASGQAKERIQLFEGLVIAAKHGRGVEGTITVRKVTQGVGVERIFPLHSPFIEKIELVKRVKVRRAKLAYVRKAKGERAKLKAQKRGIAAAVAEEQPKEEQTETPPEEQSQEEQIK